MFASRQNREWISDHDLLTMSALFIYFFILIIVGENYIFFSWHQIITYGNMLLPFFFRIQRFKECFLRPSRIRYFDFIFN